MKRVLRAVAGWASIAVGLVLLPLPIPFGLPLVIFGVWLVGSRSRLIRLTVLSVRLVLRQWARMPQPVVGPIGRALLQTQWQLARKYRMQRRQREQRLLTGE